MSSVSPLTGRRECEESLAKSCTNVIIHKEAGLEAGVIRGGGPIRSSRTLEVSVCPLGEWETIVGKRQTETSCRESWGIEFI